MYLLLIFLPLLSSLLLLSFGRFLGTLGASIASIFVIVFSFFISVFVFFEVVLSSSSCFVLLPIT